MSLTPHRVMCDEMQEIEAGIDSEVNEMHEEIVTANIPWTPVFGGPTQEDISRLQELDDTDLVEDDFHLPSQVD